MEKKPIICRDETNAVQETKDPTLCYKAILRLCGNDIFPLLSVIRLESAQIGSPMLTFTLPPPLLVIVKQFGAT